MKILSLKKTHGFVYDAWTRCVIKIIVLSTLVRLALASVLELGNDEVYYWAYARYPDLSHFDHPPMVGFLIQACTANVRLHDDFFVRLGSILLAACNTWLIYKIATKTKDKRAGVFAALLYTSSFYCAIISGFAIIPDAPQVFFWLLCLNVMLDFLPATTPDKTSRRKFVLFGIYAGLAMLSKYHAIFIWVGAFAYVVVYNRIWLSERALYVAIGISILLVTPIAVWNYKHEFVSYAFHGDRVTPQFGVHVQYLLAELGGQIAYNNPVNFVLIATAVVASFRKKAFVKSEFKIILLLNGLPLYIVFTGFSLFRSTLPHWTGPAFIPLIVVAAAYWSARLANKPNRQIPLIMLWPALLLVATLLLAVYCINYAPFQFGNKTNPGTLGEGDFTQDLYGWTYMGKAFKKIAEREELHNRMPKGAGLVAFKWFPGAHEDFYIARPLNRDVFLIGSLNDIHEYYWINNKRGGLVEGADYYHVAVSNYYRNPAEVFGKCFERIEPIDTIAIRRANVVMRYAFVYRMKNFKQSFK